MKKDARPQVEARDFVTPHVVRPGEPWEIFEGGFGARPNPVIFGEPAWVAGDDSYFPTR